MQKTLEELIVEALEEAKILECARDKYEEDNVMLTAMRLSGAPYSFVEQIALGV
jgi:hypothetical protein